MVTPLIPDTVPESLVQALLLARRIVVFTGAGMSAESGIATFRNTAGDQANSLWAQFNTRDMATPVAALTKIATKRRAYEESFFHIYDFTN